MASTNLLSDKQELQFFSNVLSARLSVILSVYIKDTALCGRCLGNVIYIL